MESQFLNVRLPVIMGWSKVKEVECWYETVRSFMGPRFGSLGDGYLVCGNALPWANKEAHSSVTVKVVERKWPPKKFLEILRRYGPRTRGKLTLYKLCAVLVRMRSINEDV